MIFLWIFIISNITLQQSPCKQGCLRCISEDKCLFCDLEYNYVLQGKECVKIELDLCQKIDIYGNCLLCQEDHYLDQDTKKCVAILQEKQIQECYKYESANSCQLCKKNHYLRDNACNSVLSGIPNCQFYASDLSCIQCEDGYILDYEQKCKKQQDCVLQTQLECLQCSSGYFLNQNYHVQKIFELSHGLQTLEIQSILREQHKTVQKQQICQPYLDQNCLVYKNETDCLECKEGYFMDSDKKCQAFPLSQITNCIQYESLKICNKCAQQYLHVNNQCVKGDEIENCVLYDGTTSTQKCLKCDQDYYLKSNYCIQRNLSLEIEKCQILQNNEDLCEKCEDDYVLSIDQLKCFLRITGCHEHGYGSLYSTNDKVVCYQCQPLHYLDNGLCKTGKIPNCLIYYDEQNCIECKDGYYFNEEDQQCQQQKNLQNCRYYSKTVQDVCTQCQNTHFNFLVKNECKKFEKIQNCKTYKSYDPVECKICQDKYNLTNNTCQFIEMEGCLKLNQDGTTCQECEKGFALKTGTCVIPSSHTVENCQQNSTQTQSTSSIDFFDVECKYCKNNSLPIDMQYKYICVEDQYLDQYVTSSVEFCLKYKNDECVQCQDGKFLHENTCISNCTKYMRLYQHVQGHDIYSQTLSERSGSVSYIRYNKCLSTSNSESCEIEQQDVFLENQGCIKCRSGYYSVFDQGLKSNVSGLTQNSIPSQVSFFYYSNVDPNITQMPFINDIGFVSPFLQCVNFGQNDFPVNECRYYYKNIASEGYTCLSCNKGFIGLIEDWQTKNFTKKYDNSSINVDLQVSKITQCVPYSSISGSQCQSTYYTNLEPLWEALFSCHVCKAANQIPYLITKFESLDDLSNMYYRTYDMNNAENWGDGNQNHTIQCKENRPEFFGYDPNSNELTDSWFQIPQECAMAVMNLAIDQNLKSNKDHVISNGDEKFLPIFCAACNPGFRPVYYSKDPNNRYFNLQVAKCEPIDNCIGRQWVNSCSKCKSGYAFKMPSFEGECTSKQNCNYSPLACAPVQIDNCFEVGQQSQCKTCNKGYNLNESKLCEKIVPPKCESSENFVIFNMQKNYLTYKFESYLYQQGYGCSKCQQNFKAVYNTDFFINCYQSQLLEDFNTSSVVLQNGIKNCQGYTQTSSVQSENFDIYEGNDDQLWPELNRQFATYNCLQCSQNTLLNFDHTKCLANLDFCKSVDSNDLCNQCADTHALVTKENEKVCLQGNIENCIEFAVSISSNNIYCTKCKSGYRFSDSQCVKGSVANCIQYKDSSTEQCSQCQDGYVLVESLTGKGYCYPMQENLQCKKGVMKSDDQYGAIFQCIQCAADDLAISFIDKMTTVCMPFTYVENCLKYNINKKLVNSDFSCLECEQGFYLYLDGSCKERENLDIHCDVYDVTDKCIKCQENYYLDKLKCYSYPVGIAGCLQYKDNQTCLECTSKMFLFEGTCVDVPVANLVENCIKYTNASVCQECQHGYFLNAKGSFCYPATAQNCLIYRSKTECELCIDGYGFEGEEGERQCVEVLVENCHKFKQIDPYDCIICDEGYFVNEGKCQKVLRQIANCHEYYTEDMCSHCEENSIITEQQDQCLIDSKLNQFIPDNCEIAKKLDEFACIICPFGQYFLNNECQECQATNCMLCDSVDSSKCLLCKSGTYQNDDGYCVGKDGVVPQETIEEIQQNYEKIVYLVAFKIASWSDVGDPTVYGQIEFDMTQVNKVIEKNNAQNGKVKLKKVHFAIKAMGQMHYIKNSPFGFITFGVLRKAKNLDVCVIKKMSRQDFEYFVIKAVETKSITQIAEEYEREMKNESRRFFDYRKFQFLKYVPHFMLDSLFAILNFVSYDLGKPIFGYNPCNFGNVVLYDLTESGIHEAFFPLPKIGKITSVFTFCAPEKKARKKGDGYEIYEAMNSTTSFDHRHGDGSQGLHMRKSLMEIMNNPEKYIQQLMNQNLETQFQNFLLSIKKRQSIQLNDCIQLMNIIDQNDKKISNSVQKSTGQLLASFLFLLRNNTGYFTCLNQFYQLTIQNQYLSDEAYFLIVGLLDCGFLTAYNEQCLDTFICFFENFQNYFSLFIELLIEQNQYLILKSLFKFCQQCKKSQKQEILKTFCLVYLQKIDEFQNLEFSLQLIHKTYKFLQNGESFSKNKALRIIQLGLKSFHYLTQKIALEILILNQKYNKPALIVLMLQKETFRKSVENLDKEQQLIDLYQGNLINTLESDFPLLRFKSLQILQQNISNFQNEQILKVQNVITDFFIDEDFSVRYLAIQLDQLIKKQEFEDQNIYFECFQSCLLHYDYLISEEHYLIREKVYQIVSEYKIQSDEQRFIELFKNIVKMFQKIHKRRNLNYLENKIILQYFFKLIRNNDFYEERIYIDSKKEIDEPFIYAEQYKKENLIDYYYAFNFWKKTDNKIIFFDQKYIKRQLNKVNNDFECIQQNPQFEFFFDQFLNGNCKVEHLFSYFKSLKDFLYNTVLYFMNLKLYSQDDLEYFLFNKSQWQAEQILKISVIVCNELQEYEQVKVLVTLILQFYVLLKCTKTDNNNNLLNQYYSTFCQFYSNLNKFILKKEFSSYFENIKNYKNFEKLINQLTIPDVKNIKELKLYFEKKSYAFLQNSNQDIHFYIEDFDLGDKSQFIQTNNQLLNIKKENQSQQIFYYKVTVWIEQTNSFTMAFRVIRRINEKWQYDLTNEVKINFQKKYTISQLIFSIQI